MATELELKLMIQPDFLESASQFLDKFCAQSEGSSAHPTLTLMNGYFDTADELLMKSGVALRIRSMNQRYIQTLKTRGSSRVGMHARGEWEWELKQDALDLSLIDTTLLPSNLQNGRWEKELLEVFRTDFTRQIWLILEGNTTMEVVIDKGEVRSPYGSTPICEIELELKKGDEEGLYNFASALAKQVPVQVSTVSKAAKGNRLKTNRIELPHEPSESASKFDFTLYWYEMWLTYWEAMCFLDDTALLIPVCDAMDHLSAYLPTGLAKEVLALKQELSKELNMSKQESPLLLTEILLVGQVMLNIGHWLSRKYQ